MGKQKRARQKFHLASVKAKQTEGLTPFTTPPTQENDFDGLSWKVNSDDIFKGLDIDIEKLKKDLTNDAMSIRSISKSIKGESGKHMKKKDKLKLRHNLFIQKIESLYKQTKVSKKDEKTKGVKSFTSVETKEDSGQEYTFKKLKKPIGIKKAKQRKIEMLKSVEAFKNIWSSKSFKESPLDTISECVENKIKVL